MKNIEFNSSINPTIGVDEILTKGTGSSKKKELFRTSESFEYVMRSLKEQFYV